MILVTCDIWDTGYISDNWEPELLTIFVTWQLRMTLDSIRNSCDVFFQTPGFMNSVQNTNLLVFWIVQSDIEHWYFEILPVTYHRQSLSEYTKAIHVFFPEFTRAISVYFPEYTRATVGCEDLLKSYLKAAGYFAGLIWQINFKSTFHLAVYYDMTNLAGLN